MAGRTAALRSLAREDSLAGIGNRRTLFGALNRVLDWARPHGGAWTIACVDLDDFKQINDRFGHNTGDAVLRAVAATLRAATWRVDVVARLGGDEFAVLLREPTVARLENLVLVAEPEVHESGDREIVGPEEDPRRRRTA